MKSVEGTFIESVDRTESVKSFRFTFDEKITFIPGQFMQLVFDREKKHNLELNKYLSLSCSPLKNYVEVTKRISESSFSQRLCALKSGDKILFNAPMGTCVFQDEYQKIAFLIGGIGITPVISILEYIDEKKLKTDICLIYSNRFANDIAFRHEIDTLQKSNPLLRVIYTVTDCDPKDLSCMYGFIDKNMIISAIPDWQDRILFIYGSPGMVNTIKKLCSNLTCDQSKLKTENFIGYDSHMQ